ncbi:sigma factor G inhibitor Gin [Thalassobacillus hwangdonensis]|uniref:Sigma factor G inhibitor Gin n=1 Tax=Thalassobacillus hwangdonensis TaxID=546108 RepID=A0ABW3L548_9BACI
MKKKSRCGVCNEVKDDGIHIYQLYICESCEKEMLTTDPGDARYQFFIEKLKTISKSVIHS